MTMSSALLLAAAMAISPLAPERTQASWCYQAATVTGYVRGAHSPRTFDGTSIWTSEAIAAASWDIPIDSYVEVEGLGTYRVADRGGGLGSYAWVDIAVWSYQEALRMTRQAAVCVVGP